MRKDFIQDLEELYCSRNTIMVSESTLAEFGATHAYNDHRLRLLRLFADEVEGLRLQCDRLRILIFGSYISKKELPGDIDVLVSLIPDCDHVYSFMRKGLDRRHPEDVDLYFHKTQVFMVDAMNLIKHFNENPLNKKRRITIAKAVEITDLCYVNPDAR